MGLSSPLLGSQAGNSLACAQFTIKEHAQFGERFPQFTCFEQMIRMPWPSVKLQLRLRISLKQEHSARSKRSAYLGEK